MRYVVKDPRTGETLAGLPTPRLIQEGYGEAWERDTGIWRLREDGDPPGTQYRRVRVAHLDRFYAEVRLQDISREGEEPFYHELSMEAEDAEQVRRNAGDRAIEWAQENIEDATFEAYVVKVQSEDEYLDGWTKDARR